MNPARPSGPRLHLCLDITVIILLCLYPVPLVLPVLRHHDDGRRISSLCRKNEVQ